MSSEDRRMIRDENLEALWREGLNDAEHKAVMRQLEHLDSPPVPEGLREALLRIPVSSASTAPARGPLPWATRLAPAALASILLCAIAFGVYSRHSSRAQIAMNADRFLQGLMNDGEADEVFDRDVLMLEHL